MEYKLRKKPAEVLAMAEEAVRYARSKVAEVEFSPEDATRSEIPFLCKVLEKVIAAGAGIVNIPDTVGYTTPDEFRGFPGSHIQGHAEHRQGGRLGALPQRPRARRRQLRWLPCSRARDRSR